MLTGSNIRFVEPRTLARTELLQLHRLLDRRIRGRTTLINQIRGFLNEYGVVISQGKEKLLVALPTLLDDPENGLTTAARTLIAAMLEEWRQSNQNIQALEQKIRNQANSNKRLGV